MKIRPVIQTIAGGILLVVVAVVLGVLLITAMVALGGRVK